MKKKYGVAGIVLGPLVLAAGCILMPFAAMAVSAVGIATAATCLAVGPGLLAGGIVLTVVPMRAPRAKLTTPAEGTIVELHQGRFMINGRPQCKLTVQFTTEDGQSVTADDYKALSVLDILKLNVGTPVSLHYNPADPQQMRIDFDDDRLGGSPGVAYGAAAPTAGTASPQMHTYELGDGHSMVVATSVSTGDDIDQTDLAEVRSILNVVGDALRHRTQDIPEPAGPSAPVTPEDADRINSGVPTQGVVLESTPTGAIVAGCAEIRVRVEVTRPDGTRFQAETIQPVPHATLPYATPGSVVNVYYKPEDEQHITLQFGPA